MAFQKDFLDALTALLRPALGAPVHADQLPTTPDQAVALALYNVDDNTGTTDSTVGVQARIRGRRNNRADVKDTADALFDILHDAVHYQLGPTPVVRSWLQSTANLGTDGNSRQEITVNYYFQINRTSPHRRD